MNEDEVTPRSRLRDVGARFLADARETLPALGSAALWIVGLALFCLPFFGLYRCNVARYKAQPDLLEGRGQRGVSPPGSWSYRKGYDLGFSMGKGGAGEPSKEAIRSMAATHGPGDELQFRFGYREGLEAGQRERLKTK